MNTFYLGMIAGAVIVLAILALCLASVAATLRWVRRQQANRERDLLLNSPEQREQRFLEYMGVAGFEGVFGMPIDGDTTLGVPPVMDPALWLEDDIADDIEDECPIRPPTRSLMRFLPWRMWRAWRRRREEEAIIPDDGVLGPPTTGRVSDQHVDDLVRLRNPRSLTASLSGLVNYEDEEIP